MLSVRCIVLIFKPVVPYYGLRSSKLPDDPFFTFSYIDIHIKLCSIATTVYPIRLLAAAPKMFPVGAVRARRPRIGDSLAGRPGTIIKQIEEQGVLKH